MKKVLFIAIFTLILINLFGLNINETYFKFQIHSKKELLKLTKIISIDNVKGNTVFAYANKKEFEQFKKLGYSYTKLPNPGLSFTPKMAYSKEEMRDWDSYPTYDTYVDMMYSFAEEYPEICMVQSAGTTVEGRELLFAKISDNVQIEEDEPTFFYTAQMHGDEIVTYIMMLHLIDYLCSNYQSDDQVTNLVNNLQIWINPLSNPDGTYHGGNNTVEGAIRYNGNDIDLNRNFPDPQEGDHPDGNSYQPETLIMMNFAEQHNIVMSANFHSGAEVVNYPWDTWQRLHPDNDWFYFVSREYADIVHENAPAGYMDFLDNGVTNGYAWYPVHGGRQDYMNYFHHCREVTIELSDVKMLPENQLVAHWNYNKESFLKYMEEALYGIRGHITDENGTPLQAEVTILNHDSDNSQIYSDATYGAYYRPIKAGTYTVQFSKEGYATQIIENVVVEDHQSTILNVTLSPNTIFVNIHGVVKDFDTQAPIEGAIVSLLDTSFPSAVTNENGEYTMENIPIGAYTFSVRATGYSSIVQIFNVTEQNTEFNFNLHISTAESFEDGTFPPDWSFSGNADWFITTDQFYDGTHSAKSGNIDDGEFSTLVYTTTLNESGQISFYFKVSSEAYYDFLKFYIDGEEQGEWSGEMDWSQASFDVSEGSHIFKWKYVKDTSVSEGEDCAWIDMVDMPSHGVPVIEVIPSSFNISLIPNTSITDTLFIINSGTSNLVYSITIDGEKFSKDKNIEGSYLDCDETSFYTGVPTTLHLNIHFTSDDGEWLKYVYISFPDEFEIDETSITDFVVENSENYLPVNSFSGNSISWGNGNAHLTNGDLATCSLSFSTTFLYEDDAEIYYRLTGDNWGTGTHQIENTFTLTNEGPLFSWFNLSSFSGNIEPSDRDTILVYFNSNNLDYGTYHTNLIIENNAQEEITIPITLNVVANDSNDDALSLNKIILKNYPNPFNPVTTILFTLKNNTKIQNTKLEIFNLKGQLIKTIKTFKKIKSRNEYYAKWNGKDKNGRELGNGVYFYRLKIDNKILKINKMILLK